MKQYNVELHMIREKILIIKMMIAATQWGLKDCKDWAEANFTFDEYMDERATFGLRVTAEQLGHLTHFAIKHFSRMDITECEEISPRESDPYDLRPEEDR